MLPFTSPARKNRNSDERLSLPDQTPHFLPWKIWISIHTVPRGEKEYIVMHQIKAILNSVCDMLEKISCIDLTAVWPLTNGCYIKFPHFKTIKSIFQDLWTWGLRQIKQFNWEAVCILKNNKSMTFFSVSFIHSFDKHLLKAYHVLASSLDGGDTAWRKQTKPHLCRTHIPVVEDRYVNHTNTVCRVVRSTMEESQAGEGAGVGWVVVGCLSFCTEHEQINDFWQ